MSDPCFAERYFATREQLRRLMHGINELARETSTAIDPPLPLDADGRIIDTPVLAIAIGETNSGKSSFLNALIRHPLCTVSDLPLQQPVSHYLFGQDPHDEGGSVTRCFRPLEQLRDIQIVDTPGIQNIDDPLPTGLTPLLDTADLVFCILPVDNPWAAPTWNALSRMPHELLAKTILVIQQTDKRPAQDLPVLIEHVTDLARKKLDHTPPIFTVSAEQAMSATPPTDSGFPRLRSFITRHVQALPHRRNTIGRWQQQAAAALTAIDERIENQSRDTREHARFMDELEGEIDRMRETFIVRLPTHLVHVAETFEKEAASVTRQLHRRLGATRSITRLLVGDRTGNAMETAFIERIRSAVESVARQDGIEVAEACHQHWLELRQRVRQSIGIDLTSTNAVSETLEASKNFFIQRLSSAAEQGINNLKVRNQLDKDLHERNLALKSSTGMMLALTTAAGICGALGVRWAPYILLGLAGFFLCGAVLTAWMTRRSLARDFGDRLLDTCGAFANTLHGDYEEALCIVFRDYTGTLSELRDHIGREKLAIEPRQRSWQNLFLTLKAIEQEG